MPEPIRTRVDFIDKLLGGQLAQGVHGLLGPIGSGKTTLAIQIAVEGARIQQEKAWLKETAGSWVFVSCDDAGRHIVRRAFSHAAKVDREAIGQGRPSDVRLANKYERSRSKELAMPDGVVPSELERCTTASELLGNHFHLVDFSSGSPVNKSFSPMTFVSQELQRLAQVGPISGVVVDYIGALARRHMNLDGSSRANQSQVIQQMLAEAKTCIANRFDCPVWLVHQLNRAANRRSALQPQHHRDAAECKHFDEFLDACLCFGCQDAETRCMLMHRSKSPFTEPGDPQCLTFDANFASLVATPDYRRSHTVSKIIRDNSTLVKCDELAIERLRALRK